MGGSWDATNLIAGDVAVIGEVGLDHPELGSTVREVATEKAGIVKPGKIVVVREQPTDALDVIEARAKEMEATLLLEGRDWDAAARLPAVGGQEFRVEGVHTAYEELFLPTFGEHSVRNVAASIVAVESVLGHALDPDATRVGGRGVPDPRPPRGDVARPVARRRRRPQSRGRARPRPCAHRVLHVEPDARRARRLVQQGPRRCDRSARADRRRLVRRHERQRPELPRRARRGADRCGGRPGRGPGQPWRRRSRPPATPPTSTTSSS